MNGEAQIFMKALNKTEKGATVRVKLDHTDPEKKKSEKDNIIDPRLTEYKQRMNQQREAEGGR